jgi:hypothetical protein
MVGGHQNVRREMMVGGHQSVRREMMGDLMMNDRQDVKKDDRYLGVLKMDDRCLVVLKMVDRCLVDRYVLSFFSPIENYA